MAYINIGIVPTRFFYVFHFWHPWETEKAITLGNPREIKVLQSEYIRGFMFTVGPYERHKGLRCLNTNVIRQIGWKKCMGVPYRAEFCPAKDIFGL
jgi:hypothetical protein